MADSREEVRLLARSLEDLARRADQRGIPVYSDFLDPVGWNLALQAAHGAGVACALYTPWPDAERRMACFYPEWEEEPQAYPVVLLRIRWNARFTTLEHRDILGSLMALGIRREAAGDILVRGGEAYCPVTEAVSGYIQANLERAGRTGVQVETADAPPMAAGQEDWQEVSVTVAALRLDALAAAGYKQSRSTAQAWIAAGAVKVNHLPCLKPDALLQEGDLISVRGKGRLRLREVGRRSVKGRLHILLDRSK